MNNHEIFELMDRFAQSGLEHMKLTWEDFSLELVRGACACAPLPAAGPRPAPAEQDRERAEPEGLAVTAPLAGIFYAAPAPDQPPFAAAGQRVAQGQTLCLLEAMKMMSEVAAPCDCVIEEVLKSNGELAAFGEPLFRYRPC